MRDYDMGLARLNAPYESHYVATRYGFTHVISGGSVGKPKIMLWHGMNVNLTMWCDLMNVLAPSYHLFAVDTIGNQGRSAPTRPDKHSPAHGEWAADVMEQLGIERAHCIGFSQGGWLIFRLAEQVPQKILSAVLLSCAGLVPVDYRLLLRMAPALLMPSPEERARAIIRLTSAPRHQPSSYEIHVFMNMQNYYIEGRVPVLTDHQLRALTSPVRLMMGTFDRTFDPQRAVQRFCRVMPHGEAVLLDNLSHGLEEDRPRVHQHIIEFLNQHAAP